MIFKKDIYGEKLLDAEFAMRLLFMEIGFNINLQVEFSIYLP